MTFDCIFCCFQISLYNTPFKAVKKIENYIECPICLEDLNTEVVELKCHHLFHLNCIQNWSKKNKLLTCPMCRKNVS